jgi:DNA repair protein RecO (recombination protein O)
MTNPLATTLHERLYRTEAIVLGRTDFGEADRILTLYTPKLGKLRVIAKGVRRPNSRLGPHLEYFCRSQLMLAKGRELDVVTSAETLDGHVALRSNLDALGHASHMAELLNRLTEDRQEQEAAFDLLVQSLQVLCKGIDPFVVTRYYELALTKLLGYRPEMYSCVGCQSKIEAEPNALSPRLGGLLCPNCVGLDSRARVLSVNGQKFLRLLDREGLTPALRLNLNETLKSEIEFALGSYLRHIAERDLTSLQIWRQLRRYEPVPKSD